MKHLFFPVIMFLGALAASSCHNKAGQNASGSLLSCSDECRAANKTSDFVCSLTTPELQQRKETVLASLKQQVVEKKELSNGFAFRFPGNDRMLDELMEFIKSERQCCQFFVFNLSISGDKSEIWLELTGMEGVKEVIVNELAL